MGAADFFTTARGKTAQEAFGAALDEARHMFGRGGYTGTIAEKDGFKMVSVPPGSSSVEHASELLGNEAHWVQDKWGPAGCIQTVFDEATGVSTFIFFGYASS